jgi:cation:H+ antiporter
VKGQSPFIFHMLAYKYMNYLYIFAILFFSLLLIKSADIVIISLRKISRRTRTGIFALSALLLALGTSLPELFVGITSAFEGVSNLTLGVVIGSNIANTTLVVGFAGLISGRVHVSDNFLKRDVAIALIAGVAPVLLILDKNLSQVDGLVLLAIYAIYASSLFRNRFQEVARGEVVKSDFFHRFIRRITHVDGKQSRDYARLFLGIALMLFSADMIVRISKALSLNLNIPVFVVGLLILAVGTSLPELAFSFRTLKEHEPSMFFGNILGSIIINSTLIIGLVSFIKPIKVVAVREYVIATVAFVIIFLTFWQFIKSKHRLDRWEAALLVLLYVIFVIIEFI